MVLCVGSVCGDPLLPHLHHVDGLRPDHGPVHTGLQQRPLVTQDAHHHRELSQLLAQLHRLYNVIV